MPVEPKEIGRLAILLKEPGRYVEKRVEKVDLVDDYHYGIRVLQQVLFPFHGEQTVDGQEKPKMVQPRELLVPLGQFSRDRMPDLEVKSAAGEHLALLSRQERARVGAALFSAQWWKVFTKGTSKADLHLARSAWRTIETLVGRAIAGSKNEAKVLNQALKNTLDGWAEPGLYPPVIREGSRRLLRDPELWNDLEGLVGTRLLIAKVQGTPGQSTLVEVTYTERFNYNELSRGRSVNSILKSVLRDLGIYNRPIKRTVANVGQAASLWIVQIVPDGVETLRYYWSDSRQSPTLPDPVSVEKNRAAISSHLPSDEAAKDLWLEVQPAASPAVVALIGLSLLLLMVSTYVYQKIPTIQGPLHASLPPHAVFAAEGSLAGSGPTEGDRTLLLGLGSLFAAIPAAVVGALAYRGQSFAHRLNRGPRALASILCVLSAVFAVVVSLKDLGDLTEVVAYIVSIYALWLAGIAIFILAGPRWRKTEASRRFHLTKETSPAVCDQKQFSLALKFLIGWTVAIALFARCQAELQEKHFFTSDFPMNILHALGFPWI
jgi:hypothetical protein